VYDRILSVIIRNDTEFMSREFRGSRTPRPLEEFGRICDVCFIRRNHFFLTQSFIFYVHLCTKATGLNLNSAVQTQSSESNNSMCPFFKVI
jgi:hypothetical protein